MRLIEALQEIDTIIPQQISVQRIPTALTNRVYQLSAESQQWALRINNPDSGKLNICRRREAAILAHIAEQPWAIKADYYSERIMLSHWYSGRSFSLHNNQDLERLAELVQQIHAMPVLAHDTITTFDLAKHMRYLLNQVTPVDRFSNSLAQWIQKLQPSGRQVLCHHDWHAGNLVEHSEQLILLDWEYAAFGEPLTDFACLISGFNLDEEQRHRLLELCSVDYSSIRPYLAVTEAMSVLWYLIRFPEQEWTNEQQKWLEQWE